MKTIRILVSILVAVIVTGCASVPPMKEVQLDRVVNRDGKMTVEEYTKIVSSTCQVLKETSDVDVSMPDGSIVKQPVLMRTATACVTVRNHNAGGYAGYDNGSFNIPGTSRIYIPGVTSYAPPPASYVPARAVTTSTIMCGSFYGQLAGVRELMDLKCP